jgi:putative transport protein
MSMMQLLAASAVSESAAWGLAMLSLAVAMGLALGAVRIRGIRLGVSGVLFSALIFGQANLSVNEKILDFLRDFALIIFVYAIGLQVGPSLASSLRREGLRLNVMSVLVITLGALLTAGIVRATRLTRESASGLYSGAYTTTPGLAAGQEALRQTFAKDRERADKAMEVTGLAYTVTYPFGVVGPIFVIVLLRRLFRVRISEEVAALAAEEQVRRPPIDVVNLEVTQPHHAGRLLKEHPLLRAHGVTFSRLLRDNTVTVPTGETEVRVGDVFRAVGTRTALQELVAAIGRPSASDPFDDAPGDIRRMDFVVTRTQVLRRTLQELDLIRRAGVTVGRVYRADIELAPRGTLRLQFGDRVTAVGPESGLRMVETELGNCPDTLNRPQLIPIFLGIVLGVLIGSIPLAVPGLSVRLRIGLAGGPMIAAILLSQLGNIGSVVWYMPAAANQLFRDFGLAVFLACVGLQAGDHFVQRMAHGGGIWFLLAGAAVTTLPVLAVGYLARRVLRMNFVTLSGWVAGAMTSSPALLFANDFAKSDAPAVAYAAVAPLGMLTPILCAQILVATLM